MTADGGVPRAFDFIREHELRMRLGIVHDLLLFGLIVVLGVAVYRGLRPFGEALALFGLTCMAIEAALSVVIELSSFAGLWLASDASYLDGMAQQQRLGLLGLILDLRASGYTIAILFYGASSLAFSYLLSRSRHVPRALALFGVFASAWLVIATAIGILTPTAAASSAAAQGIIGSASALAMLFQVTVAVWLIVKGTGRAEPSVYAAAK